MLWYFEVRTNKIVALPALEMIVAAVHRTGASKEDSGQSSHSLGQGLKSLWCSPTYLFICLGKLKVPGEYISTSLPHVPWHLAGREA